MKTCIFLSILLSLNIHVSAASFQPFPLQFSVGSVTEQRYLRKNSGSQIINGVREAALGSYLIYAFPATESAKCTLALTFNGAENSMPPVVHIRDGTAHQIHYSTILNSQNSRFTISWTVPDHWNLGADVLVTLGAKNSAFSLQSIELLEIPKCSHSRTVPDTVLQWMRGTGVTSTNLTLSSSVNSSVSIEEAGIPYPYSDFQAGSILLAPEQSSVTNAAQPSLSPQSWNTRGSDTISSVPFALTVQSAQKAGILLQTGVNGKSVGSLLRSFPSPELSNITTEYSRIQSLLAPGISGICLDSPFYATDAGFSTAFKQAWNSQYGSISQSETSPEESFFLSGKLKSMLLTNYLTGLWQNMTRDYPADIHIVRSESPLENAVENKIVPFWNLLHSQQVGTIIGKAPPDSTGENIRIGGEFSSHKFLWNYLNNSAFSESLRLLPTNGSFQIPSPTEGKSFERGVAAAMLFPAVKRYTLNSPAMPLTPEQTDIELSVESALQQITSYPSITMDDSGVGLLLSQSLQWQHDPAGRSSIQSFSEIGAAALERGVPIQIASLDRCVDPGYLQPYRTLILSFDYQTPLGPQSLSSLAEWVKSGGSLVILGGSGPSIPARDGWWGSAGFQSPLQALWSDLGINAGNPITIQPPQEDLSKYRTLAQLPLSASQASSRFNLTPYLQGHRSISIRFSNDQPASQNEAVLHSLQLHINGQIAAAFLSNSELDRHFLSFEHGDRTTINGRSVQGDSSWTYQFDNLPENQTVTMSITSSGALKIQAAPSSATIWRTLIASPYSSALPHNLPRLHLDNINPITLVQPPASPVATPLYTLKGGGTPVWMSSIGKGLVIFAGICPDSFSRDTLGDALLNGILRLAYQRSGAEYSNPYSIEAERGPYLIIHTFDTARHPAGSTINILSPTLSLQTDRTIPPHTTSILLRAPANPTIPTVAFASGHVEASLQTSNLTSLFIRSPQGSHPSIRILTAGKEIIGVRAVNTMGEQVPIETLHDSINSLLVRFPGNPDGVACRISWK